MTIPTEPIGSIPRPKALIEGMQAFAAGSLSQDELNSLYDQAVRDTIEQFEATGSPIITDGEQTKPSFATYPIHRLETLTPGGVTIPFVGRPYPSASLAHRWTLPVPDLCRPVSGGS